MSSSALLVDATKIRSFVRFLVDEAETILKYILIECLPGSVTIKPIDAMINHNTNSVYIDNLYVETCEPASYCSSSKLAVGKIHPEVVVIFL